MKLIENKNTDDADFEIYSEATIENLDRFCKDIKKIYPACKLERKEEGDCINIYQSEKGLVLSLDTVEHELTVYY